MCLSVIILVAINPDRPFSILVRTPIACPAQLPLSRCVHTYTYTKRNTQVYTQPKNLQFCEISQSRTEPTFHQLDVAGLVQCVESLTAEWKVTGLIPGTGPIVRVFKVMLHGTIRNDGF